LEKISALRDKSKYQQVLDKGIDRNTFDEGLKKLDINPGEEVIKNICYFDDFISWEQFVKIISIGLRKTPEEKFEAILSGIGGTNNG
jgi:Ca2+-binding EF-hand superfamily protein